MAEEQKVSLEMIFGDAESVILVHGQSLADVTAIAFKAGKMMIDDHSIVLSGEVIEKLARRPAVVVADPAFSVAYRCETGRL